MIPQIKAELLKLRSTRTTIGIVLGMIAIVLLFSLLSGLLTHASDLTHRRGSARTAERRQPRRSLLGTRRDHADHERVPARHDPPDLPVHPEAFAGVLAKFTAGLLVGLLFGIIGEGARVRDRLHLPLGSWHPVRPRRRQVTLLLLGTLAGSALWGGIGVGFGAIVRSQVGGIIGLLVWGFVIENLLFAFVPSVGRFAPVHAENGLIGLTDDTSALSSRGRHRSRRLDAALAGAGVAIAARRDVN